VVNKYTTPFLLAMLTILVLCTLPSWPTCAADFDLLSVTIRARVGEKRVLGEKQPESFREYDVMATIRLPSKALIASGLGLDTRLLVSAGVIQGAGKTAVVASVIPVLAIAKQDGRFVVDLGAGLALITKQRYAQQNFGGPLQYALTFGFSIPLYGRFGVGYRFLHYSDAGAYGSDTIGADFHMAELIYRF
jgi:hypothetical protein